MNNIEQFIVSNSKYCFFELHAVNTVRCCLGNKRGGGIYNKTLNIEILLDIKDYIKNDHVHKHYVLNFMNILVVMHNSLEIIEEIISDATSKEKSVLFINCAEDLLPTIWSNIKYSEWRKGYIKGHRIVDPLILKNKEGNYFYSFTTLSFNFDHKFCSNILVIRNELLAKIYDNLLKSHTDNNQKKSTSSSVRLNKYINVKSMIEDIGDKGKLILCLYELAKRAISAGILNGTSQDGNKDKSLVCVTLNGAFIASVFASFFGMDIIYFDHLGPLNHIYRINAQDSIRANFSYLLVSDVVCMGTECQIAKNLVAHEGGQYIGNITIVRIRVLEGTDQKDDVELIKITKDYNPIDYKIETDINCRNRCNGKQKK